MFNAPSPRAPRPGLAALAAAVALVLLAGCATTTPADTGTDPRTAAQGFAAGSPGPCEDREINRAFLEAFNRLPTGEGRIGECWPNYYGVGPPWPSYAYLREKVFNSKVCGWPWIGQALLEANRRYAMRLDLPLVGEVGNAGLCNSRMYNDGVFGSYEQLRRLVFRTLDLMSTSDLVLHSDGSAHLNGVFYPPGFVVIVIPAVNQVTVTSAANPRDEVTSTEQGAPPTSADPDPWAWWIDLPAGEGLAGGGVGMPPAAGTN